jgi:DNA segregation ATPase FtsK/SpoIIIE-like protein
VAKARTGPKSRGSRPASGRSGGRGRGGGRAPKRPPAVRRRPGAGGALAPHRRDIQGVLLLLFALLCALAVWWHVRGAVMEWADVLLRGLFGYGAYALPLLAVGQGVIVLRNRAPADEPVAGRVVIGGLALLLGGLGLLHLARGGPDIHAGTASLQASGGAVGAVTAEPLARLLSPWGAGAIFGCLLFLGLLITTKTPVASVTRAVARGARWCAALFSQVQTDLSGRREPRELEPPPDAEPVGLGELFDPEAEGGRGRPRRRPRASADPDQDADAPPPEDVTVERPPPEPTSAPSEAAPSPPAAGAPAAPPEPGGPFALPPPELLRSGQARPVDARRLDDTKEILEGVLEQFEVDASVPRYTRGPTVTRYEVELGPATKVARVIGLSHDIAYALASPDVRIIAPIPGKSAIGIEVPNRDRELVTLGDILHSPDGRSAPHPLTVALGKDIGGEPVLANLADMPHVLIAGATGAGKALALDTPVPTPSGWTTMGELRDGDTVFGADGQPCRVLKAHDVLLGEPCYEVEFDDGTVMMASADHLWETADRAARISMSRGARRDAQPSSRRDRLSALDRLIAQGDPDELVTASEPAASLDGLSMRAGPRVVTTQEILDTLRVGPHVNHSVRVCAPLDHPEQNLPIDAYVLGCWLGGGHSAHGQSFCADREVVANIEAAGFEVRKHTFNRYAWGIVGLRTHLARLGLLGDKHVPPAYLRAAPKQRLALLQGLMDSDGNVSDQGSVEFTDTNRRLAEAVVELAVSLGHKAVLREGRAKLNGRDRGPKYRVVWTPPDPVFRSSRKLARQKLSGHRGVQAVRCIVDVRPVPSRPVRCITVDSPDHLYLASRACIPTHNSVSLNVLVTSLLMRNPPDRVRLILIDPKRVEMTNYEGVPHLITPVVTHPKRAAEALAWAVREMELRLETLAVAGVRNIAAYNQAAEEGTLPPPPSVELDDEGRPVGDGKRPTLPFIVLVIDELADLMMVAPRDVEDAICRIAQMARAVGIHLVVATQRPSVDVVTGLIKANIPSRIAFMVASAQDSRVILDTGGADKLVGHGDMLFLPGGTSKPLRVQGAYITEKEVEEVVAFCKAQQGAHYQPGVVAEGRATQADEDSDEDPLLDQAMDIIVRSGLGSTSMLQSKMKVGFSRARRIMDQLEERGVVGPSEGSKPRDVLMTVEELDELRGGEPGYGEPGGG